MAGKSKFSQLLGDQNSIARQLLVWQVLGAVIGDLMEPIMTQVMDEVWPLIPSRPDSPADLADMVVKNIVQEGDGADEAKRSGVNADRFHRMVLNTGEPIAIQQALEALRRGIIPEDAGATGPPSFLKALRQSHVRDEWAPVLLGLQWLPLPVADAVDAVVEGQITYEAGAAQAKINGVQDDVFRILVNTRGRPPSPSELAELLRRGFIPESGTGPDAISFQQGIYEGASKDKWWSYYAKLAEYLPPPRTVTAMVREGAISNEQAAVLFKQAGLSDEMAAAYLKAASHTKLAKPRELAQSTVLDLYEAHAIAKDKAAQLLGLLGYNAEEVDYLLVIRDMERTLKAINAAIQRIGNLYINRKLDAKSAEDALTVLGMDSEHRGEIMAVWDLERGKNVKVPTEGQVASAVYYGVLSFDQGVARLVALGYSEEDAKMLVDIRLHGRPTTPVAPVA